MLALFWRPYVLGFLTDDWSVLVEPDLETDAFSAARWAMLEIAQNRPLLRLLLHTMTSLLPPDPFVWHVVGAALNLAAATAVGWLAHDVAALAGRPGDAARVAGLTAASAWLVFPFAAATQFWPTGTTSLLCVVLFAAASCLLVRGWEGGGLRIYAAAAASLAGYFFYEAFYLQFFLVIAFLYWRKGDPAGNAVRAIAAFGTAQIVALLFSRIMRWLGAEGSRGLNTGFVDTYFHWYLYVGRYLGLERIAVYACILVAVVALAITAWRVLRMIGFAADPPAVAAIAGLSVAAGAVLITLPLSMLEGLPVVAAGIAYLAWRLHSAELRAADATPAIILVLCGVCLSALPFALGNYVIFSIGPGARSTLSMSLWLAIALGLVVAFGWVGGRQAGRVLAAVAAVWTGLYASHLVRAADWARAGERMASIFVNPPAFPFTAPADDAVFVLVAPELPGRVPVVEVNHHVASFARLAFRSQVATPAARDAMVRWSGRWLVARRLQWRTVWDGAEVLQTDCRSGEVLERLRAGEIWIWDQPARQVRKADGPFELACGRQESAAMSDRPTGVPAS